MTTYIDKAKSIFLAAVEKYHPEQWPAYLDGACGDDAPLRAQVQQLLRAHAELGTFHGGPGADHLEATQNHASLSESAGTTIGPYKLLQQIGEGGFGVVYMAEQSEPVERRVALKVIKPGMDTGQVVARFEAERQALAMMDHPHIARVLDAGATDSGRPYFVMELVKGIPITQYCDEQHLTPRRRLELFVTVCQAVQHAHQKGIIHRDIKPSNVLVADYDQRSVPKIIDFGVAKATSQKLTEKTMFTQFGQIIGTFEYMSPEQAKLNQLDIDTRSDVYSLGVLLYELLTGETPFDRARLRSAAFEEMLRIIREEEPPKPSTRLTGSNDRLDIAKRRSETPDRLNKLVTGDLDWITMKALEKDRGRRYETAIGLATDVQRFLDNEAILARPPSKLYRTRKFVHRNRSLVAAATAVLLTLVVGICATTAAMAVAMRNARIAQEEKSRASQSEQVARREAEKAKQANERALEMLLQDGIAFALSSDAERTQNTIKRAEAVGASAVHVELVQAALDYSLMQGTEFREHTQRVLQLDRDNIPARALLQLDEHYNGNLPEMLRLAAETRDIEPVTPIDFLFQGHLYSIYQPAKAIELIETALEAHDSGLARAFYARALCNRAAQLGDRSLANKARSEARGAQILLGKNSFAMEARMLAASSALYLARRQQAAETELRELEKEADVAAEELLSLADVHNPIPFLACAFHFSYVHQDKSRAELAWEKALAVREASQTPVKTFYLAYHLEHEGPESTLGVHHEMDPSDAVILMTKAMLLALSPGRQQEARQTFDQLTNSETLFLVLPEAAAIPLLLGDQQRVHEMLAEAEKLGPMLHRPERMPVDVTRRFFLGEVSGNALLTHATTPEQRACALHLIALKCLADEEWQAAEEYFAKSKNAAAPLGVSWHVLWSSAYLAQMRRDENWPVGRSQYERRAEDRRPADQDQ